MSNRNQADKIPEHIIEDSTAVSGLKRFTCTRCQGSRDTNLSSALVKQPWMDAKTWEQKKTLFMIMHQHKQDLHRAIKKRAKARANCDHAYLHDAGHQSCPNCGETL